MKVIVTGGCGFIGSNFVRHLVRQEPETQVVVYDLLTYAGHLANLEDLLASGRVGFVRGDIADFAAVRQVMEGADAVANFAAESHVDRSILDPAPFMRTNVIGTLALLEAARSAGLRRFLQISTDEVYGSIEPAGRFTEESPLAPNSPYSASKASGDLLVRVYNRTYGVPTLILRSSNAYGPYQFPEKLIPLMITNAIERQPLPVYGDGQHVRDWVYVSDLVQAAAAVLARGTIGEIYNVGGGGERPNLEVVQAILRGLNKPLDLVRFVPDRPGHDRRYAMDYSKITRELGWRPRTPFELGLSQTIQWYLDHRTWVTEVRLRGLVRVHGKHTNGVDSSPG